MNILRKSPKKHCKASWIIGGIALVLVVLMFVPLGVTALVSFEVLHYVEVSNDWIGFWGSYLGALIGGAITLFVLHKTLQSNKETLEVTMNGDQARQKRNEVIAFCDYSAKQTSKIIENVEKSLYEGINVRRSSVKKQEEKIEMFFDFSTQICSTKVLLTELDIQLEIRNEQEVYLPEKNKIMAELCMQLHQKLGEYYKFVLETTDDISSVDQDIKMEKETAELVNDFALQFNEYLRGILESTST